MKEPEYEEDDQWPEDAGCRFPCGQEPMGCPSCPELGNSSRPHDKAYYSELFAGMTEDEYDQYDIDNSY